MQNYFHFGLIDLHAARFKTGWSSRLSTASQSAFTGVEALYGRPWSGMFLLALLWFTGCSEKIAPAQVVQQVPEQVPVVRPEFNSTFFKVAPVYALDRQIRSIFQDSRGIYWFGTNSAGVYRYDGQSLIQFTVKDGLSNNQVQHIQEDKLGNIWFGTGAFGISVYDGQTFTSVTTNAHVPFEGGTDYIRAFSPNDLWFYAGGGVFRYAQDTLVYHPLSQAAQHAPYALSRYGVYSILKDSKGHLWFGTQAQGVCQFDGKALRWFTENGLGGPAVLALFEDHHGILWFGNNGSGLFRYDGTSLINFTEEKGLSNPKFKVSGQAGPGTLARIYYINEDNAGNLWIGTVDAGVWKYDGTQLTNYTTRDGLTSNAVNVIYKDRFGKLWFGTDDAGICTFNGKTFVPFEIKI